ncbi:IQ domain-containing protein D [Trichoplax sp. H2]|uniref:Dynein regulatory complex protein 10 n=1 Tax=Trichoplax adhaerens TaxID=10228 RepID=B3S530_TRIAD|nr:hypothetical protein TRIADDRAFT_59176 [Trichoplax adhaerens]EDV22063.1 hypothetical protein TRIADDRAFT_59176 [Trichoplax adhaerens]RDD46467.1 IQ domain-containing protein D [Trichoplax sp. H2]|eukprot:XP_002115218.1 hypothetical protein TRIADDRAFT_59176 [Trichoplax adhaerens]
MNIATVSGSIDFATFRKLKKTHNVGGILVSKGNHGKASSIPSDVLRILDPAKKKLTSVEGQRILAVISEGIKRVEIVSLCKYAIENLDRFSVSFGTELTSCLEAHKELLTKYMDIWTELKNVTGTDFFSLGVSKTTTRRASSATSHSDRGEDTADVHHLSDKERFKGQYNYLQTLEGQIYHSCRTLLRHFSNNPTAVDALKSENIAINRQKETGDLIATMVELKAILLSKLLTTPNEEKIKEQHLAHVTQSERKAGEVIKMLEAELNAAVEDRDEEVSKRNEIIRRLKNDLHSIEKYSEEMNRRTLSEAVKQEAADTKNSEGRRSKMQHDIANIRQTLATITLTHRESELNLRKKKYKLETEVENWIQKYDQDMSERQNEIEEIQEVYTKEKAQLAAIEGKFKTLKEEYDAIMKERRIAREAAEAAERQMAAMARAAIRIQTYYRAFKARRLLQKKKEKLRKKRRKGKGKKTGMLSKLGRKRRR